MKPERALYLILALGVAVVVLFFAYDDARTERRRLAADLYLLCDGVRSAVPVVSTSTPVLGPPSPFTNLQTAYVGACEMRNAEALGEAQDRILSRRGK